MPYNKSVEAVKKAQPFEDPSEPETDFTYDVHARVADVLGLEDYSQLKFYTAVGSTLDRYHGVDGFFELEQEKGRPVVVTVDLTINTGKDEKKADIIFLVPNDGLDKKVDKGQFDEYTEALAEEVAKYIKFKQQERYERR